ncbi:hypothetical protein FGB62_223g04 [Gracilaria domingensis]|nr:hypothetical protein FGB62_223g04 [Gracilaria domingensis]
MRSADLHGHAWLYVVYRSDPPVEWGRKRVKLMCGAVIMRETSSVGGVATGQFDVLNYRIVRQDVFRNLVGVESERSTLLVSDAVFRAHPDSVKHEPVRFSGERPNDESVRNNASRSHEVLGVAEPQMPSKPGRYNQPPLVPKPFHGFQISESHPGGETRKRYLGDEKSTRRLEPGFLADRYMKHYQFYLTEYQRRPFVALVLSRLGFVAGSVPGIQAACLPYLRQVQEALEGLTKVTDSGIYRPYPKRIHLLKQSEESSSRAPREDIFLSGEWDRACAVCSRLGRAALPRSPAGLVCHLTRA